MFRQLYPIFFIDLSEKPEYYVTPESSLLEIFWSNDTILNYYMWVIIESEQTLQMTTNQGQMKMIKVLN